MENSIIIVRNLWKSYKTTPKTEEHEVLSGVDFSISRSEFTTIFGPNGSGKTTLLKILAGLEDFDKGEVLIEGHMIHETFAKRAVVFQEYDLFEWKTVIENIEFGLKAQGIDIRTRRKKVQEYIKLVHLEGHEGKYPSELSGGLKQRVAIARALAVDPSILLLDEPFAALDITIRRKLQELLLEIWERKNLTIVFVTHDAEEAVLMSDRIFVLSGEPAKIKRKLSIDLKRPRKTDIRFTSEFQKYFVQLFEFSNHI